MREIVLDTETTGLDPLRGDRLVEIGCIEIYNRMPTGQTFHRYINPERDMPAEAFAVHGLSSEFLASKPLFTEVVEEFLEFIARRAAGDPQRLVRHQLHQCRARPHQAAADFARSAGRYAAVGAPQASRRVEPARRSLLALCDRQFPPHQARRAARRRAVGRSLYRPDRGAAVATDPGVGNPRSRSAADLAKCRGGSARCRWRRGSPMPTARRIAPSSPRLGDKPIWNDFLRSRLAAFSRCADLAVSSALRRKRPAPQPAAPCSGGTGRRNRRDRASAAGSRRRAPRSR